jgi:hypothetical protein
MPNEAPPQTDEMYCSLAESRRHRGFFACRSLREIEISMSLSARVEVTQMDRASSSSQRTKPSLAKTAKLVKKTGR